MAVEVEYDYEDIVWNPPRTKEDWPQNSMFADFRVPDHIIAADLQSTRPFWCACDRRMINVDRAWGHIDASRKKGKKRV